eukprot:CAMPEP_0172645550 /NCGR_PEP_ID=MMETSP1068-20121228/239788_1 /TAXON_ID=35684 /ORGANISM="Pseudopedinella elastica, Strain CCMP716" /LENGTH=78 /DNA_ID=CAMNT_0013459787 /DNA_START=47 /DNA_END=282 /DNA_ORIENTATION=-
MAVKREDKASRPPVALRKHRTSTWLGGAQSRRHTSSSTLDLAGELGSLNGLSSPAKLRFASSALLMGRASADTSPGLN